MVKQFSYSKSNIIFIYIYKHTEELFCFFNFLKTYFELIEEICHKKTTEFE